MTGSVQQTTTLRRQFDLPEEDVDYLEELGLSWETLVEGCVQWLMLHAVSLPEGYITREVSVAIRIPPGYPVAALDMAYFHPFLARRDGRAIPQANVVQQLDGKRWQRWSRHRTTQNQWQPGIDNVKSHLALIEHWLEREPKR